MIGDNETGFRGTNDAPYRIEGWEFILAGGGKRPGRQASEEPQPKLQPREICQSIPA